MDIAKISVLNPATIFPTSVQANSFTYLTHFPVDLQTQQQIQGIEPSSAPFSVLEIDHPNHVSIKGELHASWWFLSLHRILQIGRKVRTETLYKHSFDLPYPSGKCFNRPTEHSCIE